MPTSLDFKNSPLHFELVFSSFLGVTAHWIDATFERKSCGLSIQSLKGSHTGEVLAARILNVIKEFHLSNKVVKIVTDNATNFGKAFRIKKELNENDIVASPTDDNEAADDESSGTSDDETINRELNFIDSSHKLSEYFKHESEFILPPQKRCAAHSLNLTMTTDIEQREFKLKDPTKTKL